MFLEKVYFLLLLSLTEYTVIKTTTMVSILPYSSVILMVAAIICLLLASAEVLSITPNGRYEINTRVELNCSVEGDPPPYVAWINVADGSILQNRTVNTSYVIPSVSSLHKGTYRCVAGNKCGTDSREATITDVFSKYDRNAFSLVYISITFY